MKLQYVDQEVLICIHWGKNSIVQCVLLSNKFLSDAHFLKFVSAHNQQLSVIYIDPFQRIVNVLRHKSSILSVISKWTQFM